MLLFFVLVFLPLFDFLFGQDITHIEDIQVLSELPIERLLLIKRGLSIENLEQDNNGTNDDDMEGREIPHALALQGKIKLKDRGGHGGGHYPSNSYYEEHYEKDKKSHKIQSIFQISVTSLAFLAFGGYLLCLLIHAIYAKQNINMNNNTQMAQAMATFLANKIKRIKNQNNRSRKRRKNLKFQGKPNVVKVERPSMSNKLQKKPNTNNSYHYDNKDNSNIHTNADVQKLPTTTNYKYTFNNNVGKRQPRPKRDVIGSVGGYIVYDDMYFALLNLSEAYTKYHTIDFLSFNKTKYN